MAIPHFPDFKQLELSDRGIIHEHLWRYQPTTSELTFTNFFIWRSYYHTQWTVYKDWLLVINKSHDHTYAMPPVGPPSRGEVCQLILSWLADHESVTIPTIERADTRLSEELAGDPRFSIEPQRNHFDYLYSSEQLISLAGRKLHAKRNYINRFTRVHTIDYRALSDAFISSCLTLTEEWCEMKACVEDMSLMGEWDGLREALAHYQELNLVGGMIFMEGKVEAVSLGELLNHTTAVIHVEKANPMIDGLYTIMNQQFVAQAWSDTQYINREQDLGDPGLRKAKLSYYPDKLEEKFTISLHEHHE